ASGPVVVLQVDRYTDRKLLGGREACRERKRQRRKVSIDDTGLKYLLARAALAPGGSGTDFFEYDRVCSQCCAAAAGVRYELSRKSDCSYRRCKVEVVSEARYHGGAKVVVAPSAGAAIGRAKVRVSGVRLAARTGRTELSVPVPRESRGEEYCREGG